jgi:CubicO group peptidase (beta-lactamase class C family)
VRTLRSGGGYVPIEGARVTTGLDTGQLAAAVRAVGQDIDAERYDGAALVVAHRGEVVLDERIGFAERATGRALGANDVFFTMSLAKQFTNVAALQAVEAGRLSLTTRVAEVVPEFGAAGKNTVTVADLIVHRAGLVAGFPPVPPEKMGDIGAVTAAIAALPPESTPGTAVNYSMVAAHSVLAEVLRRADGERRPYRRLLAEDVFEPLGMRDTSMGLRADLADRRVPVVARDRSPGLFEPEALEGLAAALAEDTEIPAGGCLTTAGDITRFADAMRRGGTLDGRRVLSPASLRLATTIQTGDEINQLFTYAKELRGWPDFPAHLGMGFWIRGTGSYPMPFGTLASPRTFGGIGAGSTMFWVDPDTDLALTFLSAGLMEETRSYERFLRISDMVHAAVAG